MNRIGTITFITIYICFLFSCNSKSENPINDYSNIALEEELKDSATDIKKEKNEETKAPIIDSIKMHAFDNIYFGTANEDSHEIYSIDGMEYSFGLSEYSKEKLCYFMLENKSKFETEKKANKVINNLKNIISKKYQNAIKIGKYNYIKHPEEKDENESLLSRDWNYKYDKKLVGKPYEFQGYKWNLPYKEITIGYFIDYKNKTRYFENTPKSDYYIVYVEFKSKIIKNEKNKNQNSESKDTSKF